MITAQDVLKALENLDEIRAELGPEDWLKFCRDLAPPNLSDVSDRDALEVAVDPVWQVCRRYPYVKKLVLRHSAQRERKVKAGGEGIEDELSVAEIVDRFLPLFSKLEEMEQSEKDKPPEKSRRGERP